MDDERVPSLSRGMWKRFAVAGVLIALLTGGATATVALNTVSSLAQRIINPGNSVHVSSEIVAQYKGGPQTYLILGSDRRAKSQDALDRMDPPHSDTILLVRFDPGQGQTSVLSIPRDLLVNITSRKGEYYPQEKINAAYTYGAKLGGTKGSMELAAETIEHEVFPGLGKLNGIIDVNFAGFIGVVDSLGCVYVNVDHRYLHINGEGGELYSEINLQPGYQKLCYNNALSYVRYRHGDSDFVRVARQQDFLRNLREQVSPSNVLGQLNHVADAVGKAIVTAGLSSSASQLIELAKLVAFSQGKPLRQVKFRALSTNDMIKGGSYVTSTPALEQATLNDFLHGDEKVAPPKPTPKPAHGHAKRAHHASSATPASLGLVASPSSGEEELAKTSIGLPFRVLYPSLQTSLGELQAPVRSYELRDQVNRLHHAYVIVWQQNTLGGYYDFEGSDWKKPPLISHPSETRQIGNTEYMIFADGSHIHTVAWRRGEVLYWLTNTLLEDLSNEQMLAVARSARPLH
jgi:LCP family protein required for cell wall assembly